MFNEIKYWSDGKPINTDNPETLCQLAFQLLDDPTRIDEAIDLIEDGLVQYPDNKEILLTAGQCYSANNQQEEAFNIIREAVVKHPDQNIAKLFLLHCFFFGEQKDCLIALNILLNSEGAQRTDRDYVEAESEISQKGWAGACVQFLEEAMIDAPYLYLPEYFRQNPGSWIYEEERSRFLIKEYKSLEDYPFKTPFAPKAVDFLIGIRFYVLKDYVESEKYLGQFLSPQEPKMLHVAVLTLLHEFYTKGGPKEDMNLLADTLKALISFRRNYYSSKEPMPEEMILLYKDLLGALMFASRWQELLQTSQFCLRYLPDDYDVLVANIYARYGLRRTDRKTFQITEKLYKLRPENPNIWSLYIQALSNHGTSKQIIEQIPFFRRSYDEIPHETRIRVLNDFLRACNEIKDYSTSRQLHNDFEDDLIAMTIELHHYDPELARIRVQASAAVLNGELEKAREIISQRVDDDSAMQVVNHVAIGMGLIKPAPTPVLVNSSKRLEGKERRRIITEQTEAILAEHFGSKESPKAFASRLEGDELCETLLASEPHLENLSETERKQVIRRGRSWCKEQKIKPVERGGQQAEDVSALHYQQSKLLLMGSVHEQIVVLFYALKWLANFRQYEKASGKPLKLIPQYGYFPLLENELIIPDICYDGLIVDAKLGRAFENIQDTVTRYFIVQWEHLGRPVPIPIIVSQLDPRVVSELERDPSLQIQENGGKAVPAYTLVNWKGLCDQVMGDLDARLGVYPQYRQEKNMLRSIENALVNLEEYIWQKQGTPTDLANLEILLFNCWHKILWCCHHYAQALRNTQELCAQFPSLRAGDDQRTELRLCEILKQQLERIIAQLRTPCGLWETDCAGGKVFSGAFLSRIPIKGRYYTRVETTFQYAPIPFGEEDLESPLVSPFNFSREYWEGDEDDGIVVSEKPQRKKGTPRPEDIYQGQAKSKTKYLHLVFMAMYRLANGNLDAHFTLSEVFNEFIKHPRAQEILRDERKGNVKYFRQLVRRTMHSAVGLIHYTQTKPRLYSINADFWKKHAQAEWFDDLS